MKVDLTIRNYFKYYMFHSGSEDLSENSKRAAKIATVAFSIFTLGIIPLITYLFCYDRNFTKLGKKIMTSPTNPLQVQTQVTYKNVNIEVKIIDNIALLPYDAIVNAANKNLRAGSGVCGAIHAAGGDYIFNECAAYLQKFNLSEVTEGDAVITAG